MGRATYPYPVSSANPMPGAWMCSAVGQLLQKGKGHTRTVSSGRDSWIQDSGGPASRRSCALLATERGFSSAITSSRCHSRGASRGSMLLTLVGIVKGGLWHHNRTGQLR